jgi:hypothetical protein
MSGRIVADSASPATTDARWDSRRGRYVGLFRGTLLQQPNNRPCSIARVGSPLSSWVAVITDTIS